MEAAARITAESVYDHLYVLASDGMRGRDTPSPGLEASAAYLVSQHRSHGLEPAGENGTWYQRYPFRLVGPDLAATRLSIRGPGGEVPVILGQDGVVRGGRDGALDGGIVTLGDVAGVSPEAGSLEGRLLMVRLSGQAGQLLRRNALAQASFARRAGARAVIHVLDDDFPREAMAELEDSYSPPRWRPGGDLLHPQIFVRAEVVRRALAGSEAPRRTVVFAHVSGEEKGLLGSRWFVDHPTIPMENVVANINADMVGSDTHADTLVIIGKSYSDLGPLVKEVNAGLPGLRLITSPDLWPEERLFYRSDQFHFMRKEVPSLFFFTGLLECCHRPCDDVDFVSPDKIARIVRLITHTVVEIANRDARPEWDPAGLAEVREMVAGGR